METTSVFLKIPSSLKKRVLKVVFSRKMNNESKSSQGKVLIELIEKGLSMVEQETQSINEVLQD